MKVLAIDIGGTHVKILATKQSPPREFPSGPSMTAKQMVGLGTGLGSAMIVDSLVVPILEIDFLVGSFNVKRTRSDEGPFYNPGKDLIVPTSFIL